MKNFEKYKKEVYEAIALTNSDKLLVRAGIKFNPFVDNYREYKDRLFVWLFEEYQVPALDNVEKEYLSAVIKPYKNKVIGILKIDDFYESNFQCIRIMVKSIHVEIENINLPWFERNTMYKGMKANKKYTLEELGL